jgi:hypothetical protein
MLHSVALRGDGNGETSGIAREAMNSVLAYASGYDGERQTVALPSRKPLFLRDKNASQRCPKGPQYISLGQRPRYRA